MNAPAQPRQRDVVANTLAALVRTPSVNPHLTVDDEASGEAAVADVIVAWCAERGIDAWLEQVSPGRPNVVARVGRGDGPTLVLCGHIDTVSARDMRTPFAARVENGRMYGRGAYDMKGGVAAALCALSELAHAPPAGTVLGAFVVDEEYASAGAIDFVKRHRADACVLTEPSEERLVLAHKGFVWLEIATSGVAAHGSRWDLGRSAINDMGRVIAALDAFDRDILRTRTHPLTGPASLHCAVVQGGDGWSTYASECRLRVERRTLPGETVDDVVDEVRGIIRSADADADVTVVLSRPPLECARDSRIARALSDAARREHGREPEACGVAYWMDAAIFAEQGIDTIDYGPGGAGAHAAEEWVDLDSVARCARVLADTARTYCDV